jgi:L,D-transpeptidase ErfK/SrfK
MTSITNCLFFLILANCLIAVLPAHAGIFTLPQNGDALIGEFRWVKASKEDTLVDIARRNDLGFDEIVNANPSVDVWMPREGTTVTLPHRYLLPDAPREGVVINTAEMRLYYFPPKPKRKKNEAEPETPATVESFPISIGRSDWNTPLVKTKVARKTEDPIWYPPESIRKEHAAQGDPLPKAVPAGPDNPLGKYALYLGIKSYLIHGTNKEFGIGMQVTHGCMRMYPEDIERMYRNVKVGTPVHIINQPYKIGWSDGTLYLEIHPWLEGTPETQRNDKSALINLVKAALKDYPEYPVDWQAVEVMRIEATGLPAAIGPRMNFYPQPTEEIISASQDSIF